MAKQYRVTNKAAKAFLMALNKTISQAEETLDALVLCRQVKTPENTAVIQYMASLTVYINAAKRMRMECTSAYGTQADSIAVEALGAAN